MNIGVIFQWNVHCFFCFETSQNIWFDLSNLSVIFFYDRMDGRTEDESYGTNGTDGQRMSTTRGCTDGQKDDKMRGRKIGQTDGQRTTHTGWTRGQTVRQRTTTDGRILVRRQIITDPCFIQWIYDLWTMHALWSSLKNHYRTSPTPQNINTYESSHVRFHVFNTFANRIWKYWKSINPWDIPIYSNTLKTP